MFKCVITGKTSEIGEKMHKIVLASRDKTYHKMVKNEETRIWEKVIAGHGWEIVSEVSASQEGVNLWNSFSDEKRDALAKVLLKSKK